MTFAFFFIKQVAIICLLGGQYNKPTSYRFIYSEKLVGVLILKAKNCVTNILFDTGIN